MITRSLFDWPASGWRNPLLQLEQMRKEMEQLGSILLGRQGSRPSMAGVFPALNLTEDKDHYYVRAELPGIQAKDLELQVYGKNLSIAGERKIASEVENAKYHRREREAGRFSRIIDLPGEVNADHVDAQMTNGILTIKIAKSEVAKARQITVK
jgi:HSP20 family protein